MRKTLKSAIALVLLALLVWTGWYIMQLQAENRAMHAVLQQNRRQMSIFQEDLRELKREATRAKQERVDQERELQFKIVELRRHNAHLIKRLKYTQYDYVESNEVLATLEEKLEALDKELNTTKRALNDQIERNALLHKKIVALKNIRQMTQQEKKQSFIGDPLELFTRKRQSNTRDIDIRTLFNIAAENLGKPYIWGAVGPGAFDCSGFTSYVYKKVGVQIPRTAREQAKYGEVVDKSALKPGDLLFFDTDYHREGIDHVGIYIGHNKFIHASSAKKKVTITDLNKKFYKERFKTARRMH